MKKTFAPLLIVLAGLLLTVQTASATPIASTTFGGQKYDLYAADTGDGLISWAAADLAATAAGGYLAVLTTLEETTAVYSGLIGNGFFTIESDDFYRKQAWLGATPADGGTSTTDPWNWKWVTGEAWTAFDASNFAGGEPNGDSIGLVINRYGNFTWNDVSAAGGYIVESHVPDGGTTLSLLGLALTGLGLLRRRLS
jgi:hypothetical protein